MGRKRVPGAPGGDLAGRHRKAPPGPRIVERAGHWYVIGTLRVDGRSVRIRRSTQLPARPEFRSDADALRDRWCTTIRREVVHGVKPTVALSVAAYQYLNRPRTRPLNGFDVSVVKEITARFPRDDLAAISDERWNRFIDKRQAGNKPQTRERYLDAVFTFLNWCAESPREWITRLPAIDRDSEARKPKSPSRRRVVDLRPDLIALMIENAWWHMRPQLAVEWSTGARVSSIVHGCRVCDAVLVHGRGQITFHDTKNGDSVTAALHDWAVDAVLAYLERRGAIKSREEPLFLTDVGKPYSRKGYEAGMGGQNKTAYRGMRCRTVKVLLRRSVLARRAGDPPAARQHREDARLVAQVTQHWFRHKLSTTLLSQGTDLRTVMSQGGWRDPRSALRYAHTVTSVQRAAVDALPIGIDGVTSASKVQKSAT
ncbi:tyrosine-type recombinase/integrase [Inquilinus sp.]|uniref:tyrosine-type recombinase/integrase n=1 Tax=Inquilinus sp. TaxID=1932117 RepID=UPI0031E0912C